jgi:hypothetical protein
MNIGDKINETTNPNGICIGYIIILDIKSDIITKLAPKKILMKNVYL